ncbi:MAG: NAD-dependent epimerase/dehydratase family protein, partial [Rhodospirillales bacterium]|nr:NAD-dependent epimerase/dehydratase family protein [Rhodospirillales bacterium]
MNDRKAYKVIVFGGSGFLGSYVVGELVQRGHSVTVFDQTEPTLSGDGATFIKGDIADADA